MTGGRAQNCFFLKCVRMEIMKTLGIDFGTKKSGLALSDELGRVAFPMKVVPTESLLKEVQNVHRQEELGAIVLGESRDFSGQPNPVMVKISAMKELLEQKIGISVFLEPEFLTSKQARNIHDSGAQNDASAAALILQGWLDRKKRP